MFPLYVVKYRVKSPLSSASTPCLYGEAWGVVVVVVAVAVVSDGDDNEEEEAEEDKGPGDAEEIGIVVSRGLLLSVLLSVLPDEVVVVDDVRCGHIIG